MLRLPVFNHYNPDNLDKALNLLDKFCNLQEETKVIAGGTDLIPNMKHEIETPNHVISLHKLGLDKITQKNEGIEIGAMCRIHELSQNSLIHNIFPALKDACSQIAGPQLRHMGTIGGNICLDTRCLYINQSYFWRSSLGFCLKKDGSACHVVSGGKKCVASASNDSALPLIVYNAQLHLQNKHGQRIIPINDFYTHDGIHNKIIEKNEILTHITIPYPDPDFHVLFEKLRLRKSIDFPLLNFAIGLKKNSNNTIENIDLVISALAAKPKKIKLNKTLYNKPFDEEAIDIISQKAYNSCRPLTNLATDPKWRRDMITVLIKRACKKFYKIQ